MYTHLVPSLWERNLWRDYISFMTSYLMHAYWEELITKKRPDFGVLWYQEHLKWAPFQASGSSWFTSVTLGRLEDVCCVSGRSASPAAWSWKGFSSDWRDLVASALFQTDLLPSWMCVSGPSVQPRVLLPTTLWLWPVKGGGALL